MEASVYLVCVHAIQIHSSAPGLFDTFSTGAEKVGAAESEL